MSIIVNKDSKIIVQGITGSEGSFHASQMLDYGTNIVGGVTPGKGGTKVIDNRVIVYNSVEEAKANTSADVSIIFVPPPFAAEAIIEASEAGIDVIVCISEGIPVRDMVLVKRVIEQNNTMLIGPNCPGVITVDECKLGICLDLLQKKVQLVLYQNQERLHMKQLTSLLKMDLILQILKSDLLLQNLVKSYFLVP